MKNKKIWIYLLSTFIPLAIFVIMCMINSYVPFGNIQLNIVDSFTQYPGFILTLKRILCGDNLFYSWGASLGFNIFSSLCYYGTSPLNILSIFASINNYPTFISYMTFMRISLLSLSMSFYLQKKGIKNIYVILFSTLYALMGFTSTYYYNYMWIDAIIMLPLVAYGLDKLIDENSPLVYIISLFLTIFINFYIGYIIGIFSIVYYIYRLIITKKTETIKTFIISTILSVGLSAFILMPTTSALFEGKAEGFSKTDYSGLSETSYTFVLKLLSGTYEAQDLIEGPALVYSGIISIVLTIFTFFNKKISKREKIATGIVLLFLYLSLSINALNYAWQMFQKPVWWSSRFSFIFSFFMIITAANCTKYLNHVELKICPRIIISVLFTLAAILGIVFKKHLYTRKIETYIFIAFSITTFIEMMFLLDKKYFITFLIVLSFLDVSVNTYNSLHLNITDKKDFYMMTLKKNLTNLVPKLNNKENRQFFRMELSEPYSSNDGLYFGYNGVNYFNSVRNNNTLITLSKLGITKQEECSLVLQKLDPTLLSLLNIKYIYGNMEYFEKEGMLFTNPYPLGIGYLVNKKIKNIEMNKSAIDNLSNIVNAMLDDEILLYKKVDKSSFKRSFQNDYYKYIYEFTSDSHYLLIPMDSYTKIYINSEHKDNTIYHEIKKDDKVLINYEIDNPNKDIYFYMLDIGNYEMAMKELSKTVMEAYANKNGHILEGIIDSDDDGYLFMSVPHEKGMNVFVDDKEVNYDIVLDAFVGLDLPKGHHTIHIDYFPAYLKEGLLVSGISLLSTLIYLLKRKKTI